MAMFIEATETSDESKRKQLMDDILKYNEEDLAATWAVFEWLRGRLLPLARFKSSGNEINRAFLVH
jgi:predicted RecB family nuclease